MKTFEYNYMGRRIINLTQVTFINLDENEVHLSDGNWFALSSGVFDAFLDTWRNL